MATNGRDAFYVLGLCDDILGVAGSREHRFDWLLGDRSDKTGRCVQLPVDSFWESLGLVVEFRERQHYEPVAHFDKPNVLTVSKVHRGEQRRIYDARRDKLIPAQGLRLVIIRTSDFEVRRNKIVRQPARDLAIIRRALYSGAKAAS